MTNAMDCYLHTTWSHLYISLIREIKDIESFWSVTKKNKKRSAFDYTFFFMTDYSITRWKNTNVIKTICNWRLNDYQWWADVPLSPSLFHRVLEVYGTDTSTKLLWGMHEINITIVLPIIFTRATTILEAMKTMIISQ